MPALPKRTLRSLVEDRSDRYPDIIMDEIPRSFPGPFELPRFPRGETKPGLPGIFDNIPIPGRRRQQTYEECQRAVSKSGVMHIMDPCRDLLPGGSNQYLMIVTGKRNIIENPWQSRFCFRSRETWQLKRAWIRVWERIPFCSWIMIKTPR